MANQSSLKSYSDSFLYSKYPKYQQILSAAIMNEKMIDKASTAFKDVEYEVKRTRMSDSLVRILTSTNVVLLDCDDPLPKSFKVFGAKDFRTRDKKFKVFIDCYGVITKDKSSSGLIVDEMKLVSHLINAGMTMIYYKKPSLFIRKTQFIMDAATCFAKCFTAIIDYLIKISIQETSKAKVLYLSAMYFLCGILDYDEDEAMPMAKKIAEISDREAGMLNILVDRASDVKGVAKEESSCYSNIKRFIEIMRSVMHFNQKAITVDIVVERWMKQYGPSTMLAMEFFPAFSAMMTDAYCGAYLNQQKTIEKVCKTDMVSYGKQVINMIENIA